MSNCLILNIQEALQTNWSTSFNVHKKYFRPIGTLLPGKTTTNSKQAFSHFNTYWLDMPVQLLTAILCDCSVWLNIAVLKHYNSRINIVCVSYLHTTSTQPMMLEEHPIPWLILCDEFPAYTDCGKNLVLYTS